MTFATASAPLCWRLLPVPLSQVSLRQKRYSLVVFDCLLRSSMSGNQINPDGSTRLLFDVQLRQISAFVRGLITSHLLSVGLANVQGNGDFSTFAKKLIQVVIWEMLGLLFLLLFFFRKLCGDENGIYFSQSNRNCQQRNKSVQSFFSSSFPPGAVTPSSCTSSSSSYFPSSKSKILYFIFSHRLAW